MRRNEVHLPVSDRTVKVGDTVGFKYDVEQTAEVLEIRGEYGVTKLRVTATEGDYVGPGGCDIWVESTRCW